MYLFNWLPLWQITDGYLSQWFFPTHIIHWNTFDIGTEKLGTIFLIGQYSKGTTFIAFYNRNRPTQIVFRSVTWFKISALLFSGLLYLVAGLQDVVEQWVRDGVREQRNNTCFQTDLGTPIHISKITFKLWRMRWNWQLYSIQQENRRMEVTEAIL